MADNSYTQNVLAGAQIANMRFERDARTQQLRQQAAQQQMQERLIASQAQMYLQHAELYRAQAEKDKQDENLMKVAGQDVHDMMTTGGFTFNEAMQKVLPTLIAASPEAGAKLLNGVAAMANSDTRAIQAENAHVNALRRADAADERNLILKDQIALTDLQKQEAVASRRRESSAGIASREKIASELNLSNKERDLFKIENRIDPKTGKFVSEMEFVNRHLKGFMDTGIKEDEAVKRIKAVYKDLAPPGALAPPKSSTPLKGSVRVRAPDGRIGTIPKDQLQKAKAAGYAEAP